MFKYEKRVFILFVLIAVMLLMGEPIQYNAIMIALLAFFDATFNTSYKLSAYDK